MFNYISLIGVWLSTYATASARDPIHSNNRNQVHTRSNSIRPFDLPSKPNYQSIAKPPHKATVITSNAKYAPTDKTDVNRGDGEMNSSKDNNKSKDNLTLLRRKLQWLPPMLQQHSHMSNRGGHMGQQVIADGCIGQQMLGQGQNWKNQNQQGMQQRVCLGSMDILQQFTGQKQHGGFGSQTTGQSLNVGSYQLNQRANQFLYGNHQGASHTQNAFPRFTPGGFDRVDMFQPITMFR